MEYGIDSSSLVFETNSVIAIPYFRIIFPVGRFNSHKGYNQYKILLKKK
jgi:hypothetical protein